MENCVALRVSIDKNPYFNYSFCLHNYSFLESIVIDEVQEDYEDIRLEISSEIGVFEAYTYYLDKLSTEGLLSVKTFDFKYNLSLIKSFTEKDIDTISVRIIAKEEILYQTTFTLNVLPMDYFGGLRVYPQLLASYSLPNHPLIYKIKAEAIQILEKNNLKASFEGYQSKNRDRVLQMVAAIYEAILNLSIIYSAMPPSFETEGQRIRLVDQILETKFGNCIDISLLFTACLEAIDLNPIVVITKGHAFVGVWLEDQRFEAMVNFDQAAISKRIASGIKEIGLIESTHLCKGSAYTLKEAMNIAETQILNVSNFVLSIDIKNARSRGILPIPLLKNANVIEEEEKLSFSSHRQVIREDFEIGEIYQDLELSDTKNLTKQKIWERKLLDLSLRNNLLNIRFSKSMLQLVDLKINLLEDTLADGKSYSIQPDSNQAILRRYNLYSEPLHPSEPLFKFADDEFKYDRLLTHYHQDDLNTILTHLHRNAKLSEEENGKSTLYLGVGILKWFEPKNKLQPRYAPILLIPVELSRRSVNSKFTLRSREEETMINITLLEYLKQENKLNLNSLETLPMDDSGVDVPKVLAIFRKAILNLEGWDILEQLVLGNFSFNKLILWQDISRYSEEIKKSSIVKSLIDGKLSDTLDLIEGDDDLEELPSSKLTLPIAADNSQLDAVRNSNANKSFILHGPPGTGKSQTITNIIADALANNKKVLFVSAKKAALDVVHNRLEKIGLGPFCLELHSNKSKKSDVLIQLESALEVPKYQSHVDFNQEADRVDQRRKELSRYVDVLHKPFAVGWTLYDSISYLDTHSVHIQDDWILPLPIDSIDVHVWNSWKDWVIPFSELSKKMCSYSSHPLRLIKLKEQNFSHKSNIEKAIDSYVESVRTTSRINSEYQLNLPVDWSDKESQLIMLLEKLFNFSIDESVIDLFFDTRQRNLLNNWIALQTQKQTITESVLQNFNTRLLEADTLVFESRWNQAKHSWFLPKWLKQQKVKKFLNGFSKHKVSSEQHIDDLFQQLEEYKATLKSLQEQQYQSVNIVANHYSLGNGFDFEAIKQDLGKLIALEEIGQSLYFENFVFWLKNLCSKKELKSKIPSTVDELRSFGGARKVLLDFLEPIPDVEVLIQIKNNLDKLEDWIRYNYYKEKAIQLKLSWLIDLLENDKVNKNKLDTELESILHLNYFVKTIDQSDVLNSFDANIYEALIQQYKGLHKDFINLTKNQLILKLSSKIPNLAQEAVKSSEIGILQRAIRNRGRGITIRRLFDQISTLLPRLKPCMLMSPISVAQYFDVNTDHFDLVIFDEASQLPTSEAVSALARAKQAIIVGDPKQMPPTSFFSSSKIDEDNIELEDLESILDDTLALSIPSKYLLRHYRSKHESLISFSNTNYYENKLLTFPSHDDLDKKVTFKYVDGFYDKGKTRTNEAEANAIVQYIKSHLERNVMRSLGVVTFSQTQQNLIEDLLQKLFSEHPKLEERGMNGEEPIFIKNLENVQGDERDFILFSIAYGPDKEGKLSMNFGPLNRDGGWRRLNVAVTRARYEMKVFSSIKGDQIDLNRTKSEGVRGLKAFLNFAEKGQLNSASGIGIMNEKQSLVHSISHYLGKNGLPVKTEIGTSDYRVDIGIMHPEHDHQYVLGILVDGENYYNTQTTNDRELLIPNVLESLGWNIYRIWTLDWVKNKEKILEDIKRRIETILNMPVESKIVEVEELVAVEAPLKNSISILSEDVAVSKKGQPYRATYILPFDYANSESIYYPENRPVLLRQIHEIIQAEAPISENYLFRKILKLWNTSRAGGKLTIYLKEVVDELPQITALYSYQTFYWNAEQLSSGMDYYRDNSIEKRIIDDIAPEEIKVAVLEIMENNLSLIKEDLLRATAKVFGFAKVGSQIEQVITYAIEELKKDALLKEVHGRVLLDR